MEIGVQFYTLRDFCKDITGFSESLKKVADIGYKYVQISGTCPYDAKWLKEELKKNDLKCVLTHISSDRFKDELSDVIKEHAIFDCDKIGLGWYGFNEEKVSFENFLNTYLPVVDELYENGKYFMYHNHSTEFIKHDGKVVLQHIADNFAPEKLGFTLDTFWVQVGGGDPAQWIEKLSGRVPCIHLKDYAYDRKMAVVGEGNINFDRVFQMAEKAGTKYMLVEQDDCNGENPFDCIKRSYDYLISRGF